MKALVVGGTGPTGPHIIEGLFARDFEVTIYHRGTHEVEFSRPVHHIHGDPFNMADLERDLSPRRFDVVVSNYGRLRQVARVMAGRCDRFIAITGGSGYLGWWGPEHNPAGFPSPVSVDAPLYNNREQSNFGTMVAEGDRTVKEEHARGSYRATVLRYPLIYGPRQPTPTLWPIVKRVLDGRKHIVIPGDGLQLRARGYTENCAHAVLLALDNVKSIGETYNVADEKTYSLKDFIALTVKALGASVALVSVGHPMAFNLAQGYMTPPYHLMFEVSKTVYELGYRDTFPTPQAVGLSAQWLLDNRSLFDEKTTASLSDPYAYDLEDRLIDAYGKAVNSVTASLPEPPPVQGYQYAYRPTSMDGKKQGEK